MENNIQEDLKLFNILIEEFLKEEKENPISKAIPSNNLTKNLDLSLQENPMISEKYKEELRKLLLTTPKSSSKLFFNQLFGGRHSKAVLGDLIAVFLNNSMATYKIAGPQVGVEKEILKKICQIIGYTNNSGGTFPTGGSMSNFMSLIMARDKTNLTIRKKGISKGLIAYASHNAHYSIAKNASFAGIGKDNVRYISTNNRGQIDIDSFKKQVKKDLEEGLQPFYMSATAGTTVLCSFDNISELAKICRKNNIWLHLDGALGGSVIFSKKHHFLVEGISKTDSFSFNAHKTLGTPLSTSILVVKNKKHLYDSFDNDAAYLYQTEENEFDLGHTSFECGRRNNALKLWTMWKSIGTAGIQRMIEHEFELADFAREYVRKNTNYRLYSFDNSLAICFNYKNFDPKELCRKLYKENKLMVGYGSFNGKTFVRLVTINHENSKEDILNFFNTLEAFAENYKNELMENKI